MTRSPLPPAPRPALFLVLFLVLALPLISCSGTSVTQGPVDPSVMLDRDADFNLRQHALRNAWDAAESSDTPRQDVRSMLKRLAWQRGAPGSLRVLAIDQLMRDEANLDDTRAMIAYMLPTESRVGHEVVLERMSAIAAERNWQGLKAPLVRSLANDVPSIPDRERPEYNALASLSETGDPSESIFDVFAGASSPYRISSEDGDTRTRRLEAWALLTRLDPSGDAVRRMIDRAEIDDTLDPEARTLIEDARAAVTTFGTVPSSPEQLAWVGRLRRGDSTELWSRGESLADSLTSEKRPGVRLRHLAGLLWARDNAPDVFDMPRRSLIEEIDARLSGIRKHSRGAGAGRKREIIREWRDELTWADLVLIATAMRLGEQPDARAALFAQADRDHTDRTTEYGGLIVATESGALMPRLYPPRTSQRYGDRRFVASDDMIAQGDDALFHYHFQAQDHDNQGYAGPSLGDIQYAQRFGRSCLVFTFVDEDALNADYYQPDGARIDLGVIKRPGN